jgi:voltage-gated potassium channel
MQHTFKHKVYHVLEVARGKKWGQLASQYPYYEHYCTQYVAIILHSVRSIRREFDEVFVDFEYFSAVFFTIEYCLRLWVCTENEKYKHPIWGRLRYMTSTGGIIDLLAILPFYVSHFTSDTGLIRILRLFRVFRLFKFSRYVHALRVIEGVIKKKREELVLSLVFLIFLLLIASSVMYYLESPAQPRVFSSIPATFMGHNHHNINRLWRYLPSYYFGKSIRRDNRNFGNCYHCTTNRYFSVRICRTYQYSKKSEKNIGFVHIAAKNYHKLLTKVNILIFYA